jgi:hypothetical protein
MDYMMGGMPMMGMGGMPMMGGMNPMAKSLVDHRAWKSQSIAAYQEHMAVPAVLSFFCGLGPRP